MMTREAPFSLSARRATVCIGLSQPIHDAGHGAMNTKLLDEGELLPVAQAAAKHKAFGKFHPATVQRWAKKGLRKGRGRLRLESIRVGQTLKTTQAALDRFLAAMNEGHVLYHDPRPRGESV